MAVRKVATTTYKKDLSPILTIFRLMPESGNRFPESQSGQYIALRRDDCKLTKKTGVGPDGKPEYGPLLDELGNRKIGAVTHSYSISSAPWETKEKGFLEFYVVLEIVNDGLPGRLSESFFLLDPEKDSSVTYFERITGSFTLADRTSGYESVIMVGTGTGLAPFIAMMKQLHYEASGAKGGDGRQYTVLHTNRTYEELAYHEELLDIEASGKLDFVYIPTVSRPKQRDIDDKAMGQGRANNALRHIFDLPLKEEEIVQEIRARGEDTAEAQSVLDRTVRPVLPQQINLSSLRDRLTPSRTVLMTCGNPSSMTDMELTTKRNNIRFEMEEW